MPFCASLTEALASAESLDPSATQTTAKFTGLWRRASAQVSLDLAHYIEITVPIEDPAPDDEDASGALLFARGLETLLTSSRCLGSMGSAGEDAKATSQDLLEEYRSTLAEYRGSDTARDELIRTGALALAAGSTATVASLWTDGDPADIEDLVFEPGWEP